MSLNINSNLTSFVYPDFAMGEVIQCKKGSLSEKKIINFFSAKISFSELKNSDFALIETEITNDENSKDFHAYLIEAERAEVLSLSILQNLEGLQENEKNYFLHNLIRKTNNFLYKISNSIFKPYLLEKSRINSQLANERSNLLLTHVFKKEGLNLNELVKKSDINDTEYKLIKEHSRGVYSFYDFLTNIAKKIETNPVPIVLGINSHRVISTFSELNRFKDYGTAYEEMYQDYKANDDFMPDLIKNNETIIFLVPSKAKTHPDAGVTKKELEFLLENPELRTKNVYFVFGSYDALTKEEYRKYVQKVPFKNPSTLKQEFKEIIMKNIFTEIPVLMNEYYKGENKNLFNEKPKAIFPENFPPETPSWINEKVEFDIDEDIREINDDFSQLAIEEISEEENSENSTGTRTNANYTVEEID
ncbi:MAG: hypothetical protein Tsb0021_04820 [Chlamydiales bacterium]